MYDYMLLFYFTDDDDDDIRQVHTLKVLSKLFTILPRRDIVKGIKPIKYFFESYDVSLVNYMHHCKVHLFISLSAFTTNVICRLALCQTQLQWM